MIVIRPTDARGVNKIDWLDSRHTFSFGHYYDPTHMGFGPLRVINEDIIAPAGGFPTHPHANMEIITVVLEGALQHRDSLGTGSVIRPGEVQRMSAGHGIEHSEFNASQTEPVHLLQIWIQPNRVNVPPEYAQKKFTDSDRLNQLRLIVSPEGREGSVSIQQDVYVYGSVLSAGVGIEHSLATGRRAWVQIARGVIEINGIAASAGDGVAITDESRINVTGCAQAEILLFDLP